MEELFRSRPGVISTTVGYTGGEVIDPTYKDVSTGKTGHAEALKIIFDMRKTSYKNLLFFFFRIHDPTTINQQGNDIGSQYRSNVFYKSLEQKRAC